MTRDLSCLSHGEDEANNDGGGHYSLWNEFDEHHCTDEDGHHHHGQQLVLSEDGVYVGTYLPRCPAELSEGVHEV